MINRRKFLTASMGLGVAAAFGQAPGGTDLNRWQRNEKIQEARRVALSALQPSARDLERGLALHADAVVCDTYGFAPRAAPDPDVLNPAIRAGASAREIKELMEESTMTRYIHDPVESAEFIDAWKASGVTCLFQNAGEEGHGPLRMLRRLSSFTHVADRMRGVMMRATSPSDIIAAKAAGQHCLYLSTNGVPLQQEWNSLEEELFNIGIFFRLGVRMMHLSYNRRNMLADGCAEEANGGLSDFGRAVIREMNRVGVIVDLAHSGYRSSLEAAQVSERPVVISHAACAALQQHIRCMPDEVIRAVADTGGFIGITCIPRYLGGTGDIRAMLDHIDYAVRKFGADHVGIGTDVAYVSRTQQTLERRPPSRPRWGALWPEHDWTGRPSMAQSMLWTNWPLFTVGLIQRGHSESDIRKIIGGNMLRVAREVLPPGMG